MTRAVIIPPATFVEHATRLRARKLKQVANKVEQELRIRLVPTESLYKSPRRDLVSVIRDLRSRPR